MTDREKIMSLDYYEILSDLKNPEGITHSLRDFVYQKIDSDLGIVYINRNELTAADIRKLTYRSSPKVYGLMRGLSGGSPLFDTVPLMKSGILQAQGEPLNLTGRGVVLGFLDTGIRYDDEVFRNPDGSSRILGIWDQNIQSGEPPEGFFYGTEYRKDIIDAALASENPREIVPSYDEIGYGTALASIAAGSTLGSGLRFTGAAPEAGIAVVKLKQAKDYLKEFYVIPEKVPAYAESDLIAAVRYLESFAATLQRPLVICVGVGSNMGDHEGNSVFSTYLNTIATRRSRVVVLAGGNEGNSGHHYVGYAVDGMSASTDNVEIHVDSGETGFVAELWGNIPSTHAISVRSPGGEITERVDFRLRETREFSFIYEKTIIRVDHVLVEQGSGEELILFRFQNPTPGIWTIQVTTSGGRYREEGDFHIWLPITEFLNGETYFLRPSPYTTITEPGNTREGITTTFYQDLNNSFYGESGRGFTRRGKEKPELCTPGVNISAISGKETGAGAAAALLSGICAQFMQWAVVEENNRWVESRELKNYLIRGAVRNAAISYPSREWGYGETNISRTFDVIAGV